MTAQSPSHNWDWHLLTPCSEKTPLHTSALSREISDRSDGSDSKSLWSKPLKPPCLRVKHFVHPFGFSSCDASCYLKRDCGPWSSKRLALKNEMQSIAILIFFEDVTRKMVGNSLGENWLSSTKGLQASECTCHSDSETGVPEARPFTSSEDFGRGLSTCWSTVVLTKIVEAS